MIHEARMTAEYAALGLWDEAARRARSYKTLESQLRAVDADFHGIPVVVSPADQDRPAGGRPAAG